jgi:hypothetical protein
MDGTRGGERTGAPRLARDRLLDRSTSSRRRRSPRSCPGTARAKPVAFLVLVIGSSGALFYVLGWGALLVIALVPGAVVVEEDGSRHGRVAIGVLVTTVLAGQCALALGVVQSVLPIGTSHGLACVEAGIAACLVGLLARSGGARSGEELLQQADAAMYESKRNGRGRWSVSLKAIAGRACS